MRALSFASGLVVALFILFIGGYAAIYYAVDRVSELQREKRRRQARASRVYLPITRTDFTRDIEALVREMTPKERVEHWQQDYARKWVTWDAEVLDAGETITVTGVPMSDLRLVFARSSFDPATAAALRKGMPVKLCARLTGHYAGPPNPLFDNKTIALAEAGGRRLPLPVKHLVAGLRTTGANVPPPSAAKPT